MKTPRVFLNHKWEDKTVVKKVEEYLKSSFIKTWIDDDQMGPGDPLLKKIKEGLDTLDFFLAFISEGYLNSGWCMLELENAVESNATIIPILLGDVKKKFKEETVSNSNLYKLLDKVLYLEMDPNQPLLHADSLHKAIWKSYPIRFSPMRAETYDRTTLQIVEIEITFPLDTDILSKWDFDMNEYISTSSSDNRIIREEYPIAFAGRLPAWLYGYLAMPFFNKRDVYFFNKPSEEYICIYSSSLSKANLGKVLQVG